MKMGWALLVLAAAGCQAKQPLAVGQSGMLLDGTDNTVIVYAQSFPLGFGGVPAGTRVTVLGDAPQGTVPDVRVPLLRVSIRDGEHTGMVASVVAAHVAPVPQSSP